MVLLALMTAWSSARASVRIQQSGEVKEGAPEGI